MSGKHKGDGARNAPTTGHEQSAFGSAAAAVTLASLGEMAGSATDTQNDAAIARALSTGYECFHDEQSIPSDEETDEDLDSRAFPSRRMSDTDSKHTAPAGAKPTAVGSIAKAKADAPAAAGTAVHSLHHDPHPPPPCNWRFTCCSHMRSTVRLVSATAMCVLQARCCCPPTTNSPQNLGPALCIWRRPRKPLIASDKRSTSKRGRWTIQWRTIAAVLKATRRNRPRNSGEVWSAIRTDGLFFTADVYELLLTHTNINGHQRYANWMDCDRPTLMALIGTLIRMACMPAPDLADYWHSERGWDPVRTVWSRNRFTRLLWTLHTETGAQPHTELCLIDYGMCSLWTIC